MGRRRWVWFGQTSHRIKGYGNSFQRGYDEPHRWNGEEIAFVTCVTACGLDVQVQVPLDGVLSDAAQPKGRPACVVCEAERHG